MGFGYFEPTLRIGRSYSISISIRFAKRAGFVPASRSCVCRACNMCVYVCECVHECVCVCVCVCVWECNNRNATMSHSKVKMEEPDRVDTQTAIVLTSPRNRLCVVVCVCVMCVTVRVWDAYLLPTSFLISYLLSHLSKLFAIDIHLCMTSNCLWTICPTFMVISKLCECTVWFIHLNIVKWITKNCKV